MGDILRFIGDHPVLSVVMTCLIGTCIEDVVCILKHGSSDKKDKEEK